MPTRWIQTLSSVFLLIQCAPVITTSGPDSTATRTYQDTDYQDNIGTVLLFPTEQGPRATEPVIPLGKTVTLNFDLLDDEYEFLYAKIIHCDYEWRKSNLSELDYLQIYNEFAINDFAYSANSLVNYVNYQLTLPPPTKSGNYLVMIYRQGESNSPILTRRFLVFENSVAINAQVKFSSIVSQAETHHEIAFDVRYPGLQVFNPFNDIKVAILQNHNWRTAIRGLKPTVQRIDQKYLEYQHFNGENSFPAMNEFRFFDARATQFRGQNVAAIFTEDGRYVCKLGRDFPRASLPYSGLVQDNNGGFFIENRDPGSDLLEADYLLVDFQLEAPKYDGSMYVAGRFNQWLLNDLNRMTYDEDRQLYTARLQLKQGFYDFLYLLDGPKREAVEGNFREAENGYEILVYYNDPLKTYDRIVGYASLSSRN